MKDTIGAHLAASAEHHRRMGYWQGVAGGEAKDKVVRELGAAVGHAFRAAVLAHDIGALGQRQRDWLAHLGREGKRLT